MADRNAAGQKVGCRFVGSALEYSKRDCQNNIHGLPRVDRVVAWICEEGTKDAETGTSSGKTQIESIEVIAMSKRNIGSSFDEFLNEGHLLEEATAVAIKRVVAHRLATLMEAQGLTKAEMARRMETSRAALDRLLDPENPSVTLQTLQSAAAAVGGRLRVQLEVVSDAA